jgi:hypothetical protein
MTPAANILIGSIVATGNFMMTKAKLITTRKYNNGDSRRKKITLSNYEKVDTFYDSKVSSIQAQNHKEYIQKSRPLLPSKKIFKNICRIL